jgi:hypothetical protein
VVCFLFDIGADSWKPAAAAASIDDRGGGLVKIAILVCSVALAVPTSAISADQFGETCSGTETIQVGSQAPKTEPYSLTFSADLKTKSYCYGQCGPEETYVISDSTSNPIKLADINAADGQVGDQKRSIVFDRQSGKLTDFQFMNLGALGQMTKRATAQCHPSAFHEPASLSKP